MLGSIFINRNIRMERRDRERECDAEEKKNITINTEREREILTIAIGKLNACGSIEDL